MIIQNSRSVIWINFNQLLNLSNVTGSSVCVVQWTGVIRDETLIEKDVWRFLSSIFDLERTNQLNLLPDKDLVDFCPLIESYQVTKNR